MDSGWQRYLDLAAGLTQTTRKGAEAVVRRLVTSGEVASDRAESYVDELLRTSERNRRALSAVVRSETERAIARLGLVRQADLEDLRARLTALEGRALAQPAPGRPTGDGATEADYSGEGSA